MKLNSNRKTSSRRKVVIIVAVAILVILVAAASVIYLMAQSEKEKQERLKAEQPGHSSKQDIIDNTSEPSEGLPDDSTSTTPDQVPTDSALSVSITSTTQSSGMVRASAQTNGAGTCVFLYQPSDGGKPVTKEVVVANNTCSIEISQNEFAYLGQWKLTTTYYKDGSKTEASKDVTIN